MLPTIWLERPCPGEGYYMHVYPALIQNRARLSLSIEEQIVAVYFSDGDSSVMPGRQDCVSFMTAEVKRVVRKGCYYAYEHFKSLTR